MMGSSSFSWVPKVVKALKRKKQKRIARAKPRRSSFGEEEVGVVDPYRLLVIPLLLCTRAACALPLATASSDAMGKKSRNPSKKNKAASAGSGSGDGAATNKVAVDSRGRMSERQGRRLYDLLSFLAELALPRLEAQRRDAQKQNYRPLGWISDGGMTANSLEARDVVTS